MKLGRCVGKIFLSEAGGGGGEGTCLRRAMAARIRERLKYAL